MLRPNIGFTLRGDLAVFTRSTKWTDLDEIWSTLSTLLGAGPGRFWARSAQYWQYQRQAKFLCV